MAKSGRLLRKVSHARLLCAATLRSIEADAIGLDKAKLLIYGSKILGELIKDADAERDLEQLRAELADLKAKVGLRVA